MKIIGTKFCGHDSALCYIDTRKRKIFAMSTERVTRIKHDFIDISPILEAYNFDGVDSVAHCYNDFEDKGHDGELREKMTYNKEIEKSLRKIIKPNYIKDLSISRKEKNRLILKSIFLNIQPVKNYYFSKIRRAFVRESPIKARLAFTRYIRKCFNDFNLNPKDILFYDHHLCHAVPSYYLSPFNGESAIALTIDGQGDGFFSKAFLFENNKPKLIGASEATYLGNSDWYVSIGRVYNYFTQAMGLRPNSDEGKVEALAAFGVPDSKVLSELKATTFINKKDLSINFYHEKLLKFYDLENLKKIRKMIGDESFCAVVQTYLEDTIVEYLNEIYSKYPIKKLTLSGGVAANIIMSLNIYERTPFKEIYVLPPMGDEGLALGSAILTAKDNGKDLTWLKDLQMPYFGDEYSSSDVEEVLQSFDKISFEYIGDDWPIEAARSVSQGKVCALFHGRMEFGPRALGNRSIIANAMLEESREKINSNIKKRPSYQPFCPSILEEDREKLFIESFEHKHMAIAFRMKREHISNLPCAVHVDGTARPQFVQEKDNKNYYRYLKELKKITGYGVSLNTSFNLHGRTIVRTPHDAVVDFIDCNLDELFIEGYKVRRL